MAREYDFDQESVAGNIAAGLVTHTLTLLDRDTAGDGNVDYKPLYFFLFNGITDIVRFMEGGSIRCDKVNAALKKLQSGAEDMLIEQAEKGSAVIPAARNKSSS
jgi:hypothetical protein